MSALVKARVVGPRSVAGKRRGLVLLDPETVNVRALVKAGHIELVEEKPRVDSGAD